MRDGASFIHKIIAKGASLAFLGKICGAILKIGHTVLLTHFLGVRLFGIYALGYGIFRIVSKLSLLGTNNGLLRFIPMFVSGDKRGQLKGVFFSVFKITMATSIFSCIVIFFLSKYIALNIFKELELTTALNYFALSIPFMAIITICTFAFQSLKNIKLSIGIREVGHILLTILLVAIIFGMGFRFAGALFAFLLSTIITALFSLYVFRKQFAKFISGVQPVSYTRKLLTFSIPVFLVGFNYILLTLTDRLMIGWFMGAREVGIYVAAVRIALLINMVLASFNTIFVPFISDLGSRKRGNELGNAFKIVNRWVFSFSIIIFIFFVIFSKHILLGLFGKDFIGGQLPLIILSGAFLINASTGSNGFLLQMTGRQNLEFFNSLTTAIINILLNIFLIPRLGIIGAALATGTSLILINIIRLAEIFLLLKLHPFSKKFLKPAIASLFGIVACYIFSVNIGSANWQNSAVSFVIFVLIYSLIYYSFGIDEDDRHFLAMLGVNNIKKNK